METETIKVILNHRSIRKFKTGVSIPDEDLKLIMESAQRAPTDASLHLWSAIRITDREKRKEIAELIRQKHVEEAQEFFIFLADLYRNTALMKHLKINRAKDDFVPLIFAAIDAALAADRMAIAAESLGYGICFIGGVQDNPKEIIEILDLPERTYPLFGLIIGIPDESPSLRKRLPINYLIHENRYNDYSEKDLNFLLDYMADIGKNGFQGLLAKYMSDKGKFSLRNEEFLNIIKQLGFDLELTSK
ncbi:nitroreductase [Caldisphaera lagunensis DSM 15908]|uniref:Nitroreductase n=1 Tax=Caldisphaera lagunensis (strain DSM 15908 / JCM 11604 / ANMR 0165 / IC-154) TaxID=1056495 RepID=L0A8B6_CALLD|nr:nitroreductase family protein [Caldisphaera lagunensis]AFZ70081.1 nitroreductase [Caldisphaera lagunensis DSM 15908]